VKECFQIEPGFFGKGFHHFTVTVLAKGILENAFGPAKGLADDMGNRQFIKRRFAIQAALERAIKFDGMKNARKFAHAKTLPSPRRRSSLVFQLFLE
jgi:hypothetical protein